MSGQIGAERAAELARLALQVVEHAARDRLSLARALTAPLPRHELGYVGELLTAALQRQTELLAEMAQPDYRERCEADAMRAYETHVIEGLESQLDDDERN